MYGKLGFPKQKSLAERIDLNIAVERSRLEEGEDFQPVLPTAMFFLSSKLQLIFVFLHVTYKIVTKVARNPRLHRNP